MKNIPKGGYFLILFEHQEFLSHSSNQNQRASPRVSAVCALLPTSSCPKGRAESSLGSTGGKMENSCPGQWYSKFRFSSQIHLLLFTLQSPPCVLSRFYCYIQWERQGGMFTPCYLVHSFLLSSGIPLEICYNVFIHFLSVVIFVVSNFCLLLIKLL